MNFIFLFLILNQVIYADIKTSNQSNNTALKNQPINETQYIASGILGTIPGFGIGHAIQGRWKEKGWIFTSGEIVGMGLMMGAGVSCMGGGMMMMNDGSNESCSDGNKAVAISGMLTFLGFKVWEIVDVWTNPPAHNRKLEEIQNKTGNLPTNFFIAPLITRSSNGIVLSLNF